MAVAKDYVTDYFQPDFRCFFLVSSHAKLAAFLGDHALVSYRYKFHRYEIQEKDIAMQHGYLFRSTTYIPIRRIQHIETDQGIFLRKYSLVSLQIHTAATNHTIEGLPVAQAERLRETIMTLVEVVKDDL